jgi:hypothetical protein
MATEFVKRGMGCSITDIFSAQHNLAPGDDPSHYAADCD